MNKFKTGSTKNLLLIGSLVSTSFTPLFSMQAKASPEEGGQLGAITITGTDEDRARAPGSIHKIGEESLEQWHYTDVNRVLEEVPGVYMRKEDGYGLRPNIGMRGSDSNRSKKITLMEDSVLFAPAPYSAPAAYYFPMMSRMQAVEVYKGLSSIKYGPNSVGGAINFVSRETPMQNTPNGTGTLDISAGSYGFKNLHGFYGNSYQNFGWLLEGVHMQSDGFKKIDGGGDTGFDKNEVTLKLRFNSDPSADIYHQLDVKLGYANEVSNETYLGLTDDDFAKDPYRRYIISGDDKMEWQHQQFSLNYFLDPGGDFTINTVMYRREFSRVWDKVGDFSNDNISFNDVLRNPNTPGNIDFYNIMTGQSNSNDVPEQQILMEAKDRDFISQGIQTQLDAELYIGGYQNNLAIGLRYHEDEVVRDHTMRQFEVTAGSLAENTSIAPYDTKQDQAKSQAVSLFLFNEIIMGDLAISGGVRGEFIRSQHLDESKDKYTGIQANKKTDLENTIILPGIGVNYKITDSLRLVSGVHQGFVNLPPGSPDDALPEKSVNYELGFRYINSEISSAVIGFYSDYSNLSVVCDGSSGCRPEDVDKGFRSGDVDIWGLEADMHKTFKGVFDTRLAMPVTLVYTYTDSEFQTTFSAPRPDLGDVKPGDELAGLPKHLLTARVGLTDNNWQGALAFNYTAEARTISGSDAPIKEDRTDAQHIVDFSFNYFLTPKQTVYFTVDNVTDEASIVARRPFGVRPGKPRTFMLGYKISL